jgi:hypothetical protein
VRSVAIAEEDCWVFPCIIWLQMATPKDAEAGKGAAVAAKQDNSMSQRTLMKE